MGRRASASHGLAAFEKTGGLTLDTGALIALERNSEELRSLLYIAQRNGQSVAVPAGALAQAWRGSRRQHRLVRLLDADDVEIPALDMPQALAAGAMLAARGGKDVIDASVVLTARERGHWVATSDAKDLRRLDPDLPIIEV